MTDTKPDETHASGAASPDPKIYAPFISLLETEHPKLAAWLVGIGDAPVPYDARKVAVTAHFQTPAGTPFHGTYHTEAATSHQDAKEFLGVMLRKYAANCDSDRKILESPANTPGPLDRPAGAVAPDRGDTLEDGTPRYEPERAPGENPPEKPTDAGGAAEGEFTPPPGSPEDTSARHAEAGQVDDDDADWNEPTKSETP